MHISQNGNYSFYCVWLLLRPSSTDRTDHTARCFRIWVPNHFIQTVSWWKPCSFVLHQHDIITKTNVSCTSHETLTKKTAGKGKGAAVQKNNTGRWVSCFSIYLYINDSGRLPRLPQTRTIVLSRLGRQTTNDSMAEGHSEVIMWLTDKNGLEEEAQPNKPQQQTIAAALVSESQW